MDISEPAAFSQAYISLNSNLLLSSSSFPPVSLKFCHCDIKQRINKCSILRFCCSCQEHVKPSALIGYSHSGMWRSAAQQLGRQKLDAVGRSKAGLSFALFRQVITFQSTSNLAATNVQSIERSSEVGCGSEFKSGLRFVTATSNSLSPLDSAFIELVDLLPQCWQTNTSVEHNQESYHASFLSKVPQNQAFASATETGELIDEEIKSSESEDLFEDEGPETELDEEKKKKKQKYRALYNRQVKAETEAWQQAAVEYKEMMLEMCRKNLATNLPFAQSLLLGWFEPLRCANRSF